MQENKFIKIQLSQQAQDIYPFNDIEQQVLFNKIIHELRCSVCQNQNLSDSMAPLAIDLRSEIYQRVQLHYSETEIIKFVTSRYGKFVLYSPPLQWGTVILWFGPLLILLMALAFLKNSLRTST